MVLMPGQSAKGTYMVTNDRQTPMTVTVSRRDWFVSEENKAFECAKWLFVSTKKLVLKPGETKPVNFRVKTPAQARGALFAMISLSSKSQDSDMLNVVVSVPVFVILSGTGQEQGKLEEFIELVFVM